MMSSQFSTIRDGVPGSAVKVSVITATYNRARTLPRTYEALKGQTFCDFEWVIVDDGSSDGTESLVRGWQAEDKIRIVYAWKSNGGVHTARNAAVAAAHGELVLQIDSDDWCEPYALEELMKAWESIPSAEQESFSGVTCLCRTPDGQLGGDKFPHDVMDAYPYEMDWQYHIRGDKWGTQRRDLMSQYPFPVFSGEKFCPEALVWNRIGKRYRKRFINRSLLVYDRSSTGLSGHVVVLRASNPRGYALYYGELAQLPIGLKWRLGAASYYWCAAMHAHGRRLAYLRRLPLPWFAPATLTVGTMLYMRDLIRLTRESSSE
jgi:glycosyltransferase involved in cell wall biosynthesis